MSRKTRATVWSLGIALLCLWSVALAVAGRTLAQGGPTAILASPNGRWFARVELAPSLDPPAPVLELGRSESGPAKQLKRLAPDGRERCDEIAWSADGGRVGFLVNHSDLLLYATPDGRFFGRFRLVSPEDRRAGREACWVDLSADGSSASFELCSHDQALCFGQREVVLTTSTPLAPR